MKKRSFFAQLGISLVILILVSLVASVLFQMADEMINGANLDEEYIHPIVNVLSGTMGILAVFFEYMIEKNKYITYFFNNSEKLQSSIGIYEKKQKRLFDKTKDIVDNYLVHEKSTHLGIAKERLNAVNSIVKLENLVEAYPDIKANETINQLLHQINELENQVSNSKQIYNNSVLEYNTAISTFPGNLFNSRQRLSFYKED